MGNNQRYEAAPVLIRRRVTHMRVRIGVLGGDSLGIAVAVGWVERGYRVILVEPSPDRFQEILKDTFFPYEQDFKESFRRAKQSNRLEVSTDFSKLSSLEFLFVCVENIHLLWTNVKRIESYLADKACLIIKSTVPVGTADELQRWFDQKRKRVEVISLPEFLRKGKTLTDILRPARIIMGG